MEKEIIEKLNLIEDYEPLHDAFFLYGLKTYKIKGLPDVEISEFDRFRHEDLTPKNCLMVVASYKNKTFSKLMISKEFLIQCPKDAILNEFKELKENAERFYYKNK